MSTDVKYNDTTIATLSEGQTATMPCKDKIMKTDIIISGACEISYNGETIATLSEGQKATLNCSGKKMSGDVVVSVTSATEQPEETYTVSGTWYFNSELTKPADGIAIEATLNFNSEGSTTDYVKLYVGYTVSDNDKEIFYVSYKYRRADGALNYSGVYKEDYSQKWIQGEAYRTITFDGEQAVRKEFYEWLCENATRPVSGTWVFKEDIPNVAFGGLYCDPLLFKCNGVQYYDICVFDSADGDVSYGTDSSGRYGVDVYNGHYWTDEAYRTITFDGTQYMDQFNYELFILDAVFAFTINGETYYAEDGMTWGEWIASEYNTGGFYAGTTFIFVIQGSDKQQYYIANTWLEQTIYMNGSYVLEVFNGPEPT